MAKRKKLSDDPLVRLIRAHGLADLRRALTFTAAWSLVAESIGHEPTLAEYQDWWNASERTTYREQSAFRKVTGMETPSAMYREAKARGVEFDREGIESGVGGFAMLGLVLPMIPVPD